MRWTADAFIGNDFLNLTAAGPTSTNAPLRRKRSVTLALIACTVVFAAQMLAGSAVAQPVQPSDQPGQATLAPLRNQDSPNVIPDQYIVVFKSGVATAAVQSAQELVRRLGGTVLFTYTAPLGLAVKIPPSALPALRALPNVDYIEADQKVNLRTVQPPIPNTVPPTGIDRVDRRLLPLNQTYTYSETGTGVNAYVIDTGIFVQHTEFGGRATWGADFSGVTPTNQDCVGHGTHVAGIIGGTDVGIAKNVHLVAVRVFPCSTSTATSNVIAGINWVTNNAVLPAVANMSFAAGVTPTEDAAVTAAVAKGVTFVVAAGNNGANACNFSPAHLSATAAVITVGAVDPTNDTEASFSNWGTCVRLFAPGVNIVSSFPNIPILAGCTLVSSTTNSQTANCSGTSMASPHVAGVAARFLQTHPAATPAQVWTAIHAADDVNPGTAGWPGVGNLNTSGQTGSPNELLHWGSLNNGVNDGDPHLVTVDGVHYDFQGAGEYVALRDGNGLEIQTRQIPVPTAPPATSPYTGLSTCVSLNTAIAARVGSHRITYEPNLSGVPDPSGLQLRVDGVLTTLPATGVNVGPGGRVIPSPAAAGAVEIDFPDGSSLTATPNYWPPQGKWYINLSVFNTPATEGLMGATVENWLPALPNGSSVGPLPTPMPAAAHARFVDLYQKFGDAWRVSNTTTLFDYAPGTSTATFTNTAWPPEKPPCNVPNATAAKPISAKVAQQLCSAITADNRKADCIFDSTITGEPGFAKTYLVSQRIEAGATTTTVNGNKETTQLEEIAVFTATVQLTATRKPVTTGTVQFTLDGKNVGDAMKLNAKGLAVWRATSLAVGNRQVGAVYTPPKGSALLPSRSLDTTHTVVAKQN